MAISSRDNAHIAHRAQPTPPAPPEAFDAPPPSPAAAEDDDDDDGRPARKHACPMCHKAFDRPVTLKKHLVVHTGERAFQCAGCSKRFNIASNCTRHMRKCCPAQLPAASPPPAAGPSSARPSQPAPPAAPSGSGAARPPKRRAPPADTAAPAPRPKRRRRAPSPSHWVPDSLRVFDLTPYAKATPVPLPPVAPSGADEERDSFDTAVGASPYHPDGWNGRLPGPALLEPESHGPMGVRMFVISA